MMNSSSRVSFGEIAPGSTVRPVAQPGRTTGGPRGRAAHSLVVSIVSTRRLEFLGTGTGLTPEQLRHRLDRRRHLRFD